MAHRIQSLEPKRAHSNIVADQRLNFLSLPLHQRKATGSVQQESKLWLPIMTGELPPPKAKQPAKEMLVSDDGKSYEISSNDSYFSLNSDERIKLKGIVFRLFGKNNYEEDRAKFN